VPAVLGGNFKLQILDFLLQDCKISVLLLAG
jgi:hypothetical protein